MWDNSPIVQHELDPSTCSSSSSKVSSMGDRHRSQRKHSCLSLLLPAGVPQPAADTSNAYTDGSSSTSSVHRCGTGAGSAQLAPQQCVFNQQQQQQHEQQVVQRCFVEASRQVGQWLWK
jgi:hypothetical protein